MIRRKTINGRTLRSQFIAAVMATAAVTIGAECVRAASHFGAADVTGSIDQTAKLGPAELDPVFQRKLLDRVRGHYERAHAADAQMLLQGKIRSPQDAAGAAISFGANT